MKRRAYALSLPMLLLFFCMLLSACSSSMNSSSMTNASLLGLNEVVRAAAPDANQVASAQGNSYVFVRNEQLWVSLNGAQPVQATHFDYSSVGGVHANVFWNQPLWFGNGRYVVFELKALQGGLGGAGCGYIGDYARTSSLSVLDTTTMQISKISVAGEKGPNSGSAYDGYWEYLFKEDATHLLAWHYVTGNTGGLYRYDFATKALSLVLPAKNVSNADSNSEAFFPMRYSNGQLYYEVMNKVAGSTYNYVIYSHSLAHPNTPSVKVLDAGTQVFCDVDHNNWGVFRELGWDVSPDGRYLAAQKIVKDKQGKVTSTIQAVALNNGAVTPLFPGLAAGVLSHDLALSWAPDSKTIVLQSNGQTPGQGSFYSTTITKPAVVQSYAYSTNFEYHAGHIAWKSDSASFAFSAFQEYDAPATTNTYVFTIGKAQGQVLLNIATNFAWA